MLLVIGASFAPLLGFSIFGVLLILFPELMLNFRNYNASMKGSLSNNNLEFRNSSIMITRIFGFIFILIGIGIFMHINGWLDSFIL